MYFVIWLHKKITNGTIVMFKNHLLIALRNLRRNKVYTGINILGLTIGISATLIIFLIVQFELSFDNFHKNKAQIYRVISHEKDSQGDDFSAGVPLPTKNALQQDCPELLEICNINSISDSQIDIITGKSNASQRFKEEDNLFYTDPAFFKIFHFSWLIGSPAQSLKAPNQVVLTRSIAEKYFGDYKKAMGQQIRLNQLTLLKVSGILQDPPANTDFPLGLVISYQTFVNIVSKATLKSWGNISSRQQVYALASPASTVQSLKASFGKVVQKYNQNTPDTKQNLIPQPLGDLHFNTVVDNFSDRTVSKEMIGALIIVAIFLTLVACINFINLSTAQIVNRSKEIGVRKLLGSTRGHLMMQFLGETLILVLISVFLAIALTEIMLPFIKIILDSPIPFNLFSNTSVVLFLLSLTLGTTLLAGAYPAFVALRFNSVQALKNTISAKTVGGLSLRRSLVILQFILAQVLIIGLLAAIYQMNFLKNIPLGFQKEALITIPIPRDKQGNALLKNMESLRQNLQQIPGVEGVTFASTTPSSGHLWYGNFTFNHSEEDIDVNVKPADPSYFKTYGLKLITGRVYQASDTIKEFVINEKLVQLLGIQDPNEALGKTATLWGELKGKIVGVVKNFHITSLHETIDPGILTTGKDYYSNLGIKLKPTNFQNSIVQIQKIYQRYYPKHLFEYEFLDKTLEEFYEQENQLLQMFRIFAIIGIFISCLGVYGLVSYMAVQKNKEVGIRKVLGASFINICFLFYREFITLVLIAFAIAAPIGWYLMQAWLQNFAYRIDLHWSIFAFTIFSVLLIALITISTKAFQAAFVNPVDVLKDE